jgi:hypothetical protein
MPRPRIEIATQFRTSTEACKILGLTRRQLNFRIQCKVFPRPTLVDRNGVKYFSEQWLKDAQMFINKEAADDTAAPL